MRERYLVFAGAFLVQVVEEGILLVGVSAFVDDGMVVLTVFYRMLFVVGAGGGLEGLDELFKGAAVLDIFHYFDGLVLIVPFVHF